MSIAAKILADAKAFKAEILKIAGAEPAIAAKVTEYTPEVEALVALAFPQAGPLETALTAVVSAVEGAVTSAGTAAGSNGVNAAQDQTVIAAIEAVEAAIKKAL
jgi:hypothetical protein